MIFRTLVVAALLATGLPAQRRYGAPCNGAAACASVNVGLGAPHEFTEPCGHWFYICYQAPAPLTISGFSLLAATCRPQPTRVACGVHEIDPVTREPGELLRAGRPMALTENPEWRSTTFDPLFLNTGDEVFLLVENEYAGLSIAATTSPLGSPIEWCTQELHDGLLTMRSPNCWLYRLHCGDPLSRIELTGSTRRIGNPLTFDCNVTTGVSAALNLGLSGTQAFGAPLPLDMALFGAPGCDLLTSLDGLFLPGAPSGSRVAASIPVPNLGALIGLHLFAQWFIDPLTGAQLRTSDAMDVALLPAQPDPVVAWAHSGGDKVRQDELRASFDPIAVRNSVWNGTQISTFGARNEVTSFALVIEAPDNAIPSVSVALDQLVGPNQTTLSSGSATGNQVFDYVGREIEGFYVRYLEVRGLSRMGYDTYDERHVPSAMQRPYNPDGFGIGRWSDRPGADKNFPDIAIPLEVEGDFDIAADTSQLVWFDIYIPKTAPAGTYRGDVVISSAGAEARRIPVELEVLDFELPDEPSSETMVYLGYDDINDRFLGVEYPDRDSQSAVSAASDRIRDNYFKMGRRHRLTMIDQNESPDWEENRPQPHWTAKLDGSFYTAVNGYAGPGVGLGHSVFMFGAYASWRDPANPPTQTEFLAQADALMSFFDSRSLPTEVLLYLHDEFYPGGPGSAALASELNDYINWLNGHGGPGGRLKSFMTVPMPVAQQTFPNLDVVASILSVGETAAWDQALQHFQADGRQAYLYNGLRPATGSFATEDDGVSPRMIPWAQYKRGVDRWFFWESTYYENIEAGEQTDVFATARTFGSAGTRDPLSYFGDTSGDSSNGDGVLMYPGTDLRFPASSYGLEGPFASLRMKHWRRGLQDVEYLHLAAQQDPAATAAIVARMVPTVLWEYGVSDPQDPTYTRTDISWSIDPEDWEAARAELAAIIDP